MSINKKQGSLLLIMSILSIVTNPDDLSSQENIDVLRGKIRLGIGISIGAGLTLAQGILLFGYTPQLTFGNKVCGLIATAAAVVPVSILTTNLFFDFFSIPNINQWASIHPWADWRA
jgi:hypothetical protein